MTNKFDDAVNIFASLMPTDQAKEFREWGEMWVEECAFGPLTRWTPFIEKLESMSKDQKWKCEALELWHKRYDKFFSIPATKTSDLDDL